MSGGCPQEGKGSSCVQENYHMEGALPVTDQGGGFWEQGSLEFCVRPTRMCSLGIPGETEEAQPDCLWEGGLWGMWEVLGTL